MVLLCVQGLLGSSQQKILQTNISLLTMESLSRIRVSMNKLTQQTRAQVLHLLCEGQSIRAVTRLTGCSKNTVSKLLVSAGHACAAYQDKALRNLPCKRVQMDEIWSFVYAKNANVQKAKNAPDTAGDVWTWTAICADTKLLVSWFLGQRDYAKRSPPFPKP